MSSHIYYKQLWSDPVSVRSAPIRMCKVADFMLMMTASLHCNQEQKLHIDGNGYNGQSGEYDSLQCGVMECVISVNGEF